jgi:hypothetical protein
MRPALLAVLLAAAGCASIPAEEKALLSDPVECARAEEQIAALAAARPGDFRKARVLASSFTPGGFAAGVATSDFDDRERVLSGAHAEAIDARIAVIRSSCGLA